MNEFYVYMYLREDGTPYYVGKGTKRRAFSKTRTINRPSKDRIVFPYTNLTEEDAFQKEIELIAKYGRKNNSTGILRNRTDGGEGTRGRVITPELREKLRQAGVKRANNIIKVCPKCKMQHKKRGPFCGYSCANAREQTPEIRASKSEKLKIYHARYKKSHVQPH